MIPPGPDLGPRWEWMALLGTLTGVVSIIWTAAREPAAEVAGVALKGIAGAILTVAWLSIIHSIHPMPATWEVGIAASFGLTGVEGIAKVLNRALGPR